MSFSSQDCRGNPQRGVLSLQHEQFVLLLPSASQGTQTLREWAGADSQATDITEALPERPEWDELLRD